MCKQRECIGVGLVAFGAGVFIGTILCSICWGLLLALGAIGAGLFCLKA